MTVGVAAVAGRNPNDRRADKGVPTEAIVLVADRRLTDSRSGGVTDAWVPKIRGFVGEGAKVRTTWSALFAGDSSLVDEIKAQFRKDGHEERLGSQEWPKLEDVAEAISESVKKVWERGYDAYVYEPLGLTRDLVVKRKDLDDLADLIVERVIGRGRTFTDEVDFGCDLALCGFDDRGRSAVLTLDERGEITRHFDTGFCAIGEGEETATARLELLGYQPSLDLGTVLYMALDAKLTAERVGSVGPSTDAWVLVPHQPLPHEVPPSLIDALSSVRRWLATLSPFSQDTTVDPTADWTRQLENFVEECYAGSKVPSSTEREPPSWLSRTVSRGTILRPAPAHLEVPPAALARLRRGSSRPSRRPRSEKR
jgi:hypothetical protein